MTLRLPPDEYAKLCSIVLGRDGFKCKSCEFRQSLHVHHIVFRSQEGPDEEWNLVTLCSSCHNGVHKDIHNGEFGLVITVTKDPYVLVIKRASWWRPK